MLKCRPLSFFFFFFLLYYHTIKLLLLLVFVFSTKYVEVEPEGGWKCNISMDLFLKRGKKKSLAEVSCIFFDQAELCTGVCFIALESSQALADRHKVSPPGQNQPNPREFWRTQYRGWRAVGIQGQALSWQVQTQLLLPLPHFDRAERGPKCWCEAALAPVQTCLAQGYAARHC